MWSHLLVAISCKIELPLKNISIAKITVGSSLSRLVHELLCYCQTLTTYKKHWFQTLIISFNNQLCTKTRACRILTCSLFDNFFPFVAKNMIQVDLSDLVEILHKINFLLNASNEISIKIKAVHLTCTYKNEKPNNNVKYYSKTVVFLHFVVLFIKMFWYAVIIQNLSHSVLFMRRRKHTFLQ